MSIATVSTNKLRFGIQTILGDDDEEDKFSEWTRLISESYLSKKSHDKDNSLQYHHANPGVPYHLPCQNIKAAFEATPAPLSSDYCKFIRSQLLVSGTEIQDSCHCDHLVFSTPYSPIRYGFPSTSVAVPNQLTPFSGNSPFITESFVSSNVGGTGDCSTQLEKMNGRDCSKTPRRVGHPYQSRAPARHKKPRTSFTKKQIASLETRFLAQKYLASAERVNLANELEMSDVQVKTWFQNRRTKWRRQEAEEKEYENKANGRIMSCYSNCFFARPDVVL